MMTTQLLCIDVIQDNKVRLSRKCPFCHAEQSIVKPFQEFQDGLEKTRKGILIQKAFPNWTPSERELILSGICDKCFASL